MHVYTTVLYIDIHLYVLSLCSTYVFWWWMKSYHLNNLDHMIFRAFFSFNSVDGLPSTNLTYPTKRCNGEKHRLKSVCQNNPSDLCHFSEVLPFLKLMQYLKLNGWKYEYLWRNMSFSDSHLFGCFSLLCYCYNVNCYTHWNGLKSLRYVKRTPFFPYLGTALRLWFFFERFLSLSLSLSLNPNKYLLVVCWPQTFKDMFPQRNKHHKTLNMMKFLRFICSFGFWIIHSHTPTTNHKLRPLQPWHNYCRVIH